MPLEQLVLAILGLGLAVLVAAAVGGRIGRLIRRRMDTRGSSAAIARLGTPRPLPTRDTPAGQLDPVASAAAVARLGSPLPPPGTTAQPIGQPPPRPVVPAATIAAAAAI